ncbi:peptide ABC transporter permease [Pacificitalea manganoxidans]|uniref:Peptide ABC transporter permease n=1 Tax=Pacificitalea manganoxidans TaxID=1411902 RepID=A0A291LWU4_9RHOB|nr:ABC transporter permease [Pacificitalea manganoxidans]ATI41179.1 peptide ABC transporter permease [Pacificitalea manganoxidans]MDR6308555.1 peptide/nickel transport system permease protein [Pacificitalea manganoxidans]
MKTVRALLRNPQGAVGLALCTLVLFAALFGPALAPNDPETFHFGARFAGPSVEFPLGTDWYGRDLLSRVLVGARSTVLLALLATVIGTVAGALIGIVSGYLGGVMDEMLMRLTDAVMAIPSLLFALMILAALGSSALNAVLAIGIAFAPGMARIARSVTLQVRSLDYVAAAKARGESLPWIVGAEILPNTIAPVIVEGTIRVAFAIMTLATLSFLGLGAQPPSPEWGLMIAEARDHLFRSPWPVAVPGAAIALVAIGFNLLGDGLRDVLNPKTGDHA